MALRYTVRRLQLVVVIPDMVPCALGPPWR
jgi:hypothetical protein